MTPENAEADLHRKPNEPTATHANGSPHFETGDFARRTKAMFSKLQSSFDARMKGNPYATFGVALALGAGAALLPGSRILRIVLAGAASYALIELGRSYLPEKMASASEGVRS